MPRSEKPIREVTGSLQAKKGMYYAVLYLEDDKTGKKKHKWVSTGIPVAGNNKRVANRELQAIINQYRVREPAKAEAIPDGPQSPYFADYLYTHLDELKDSVDEITLQGYKSYVDLHIAPFFSNLKIRVHEVSFTHIDDYVKLKSDNAEPKKNLSTSSLRKHMVVIKGALMRGLKDNYRSMQEPLPTDFVKLPKTDSRYTGGFYTLEQVQELMRVVKGESIEPAIYIAVCFGLRRSEICGLKWDAIDFKQDTLIVKRTKVKVTETVEKERTKNTSSKRTLPLSQESKQFFLDLHNKQQEQKKFFGDQYQDTDYVCRWPDGRPLEPDYITHRFRKVLENNGLQIINLHALRHTTASLLLKMDFSIKDIGDFLGHSNYNTTANIYAHLDQGRKKTMSNSLSKSIQFER